MISLTGRQWSVASPTAAAEGTGLPEPAASLLAARAGDQVAAWLKPSLDHLHDPHDMDGMAAAVARIKQAVGGDERIRIVTDYDVDGTTSSLILQRTLWLLGAKERVDHHIPDRMTEGYGFSVEAAEQAAADGVGLILTADIGVRDHAAVRAAKDAGVDVIICDHHLPAGADVPEDAAVVLCPPQEACSYPNPALAACGVSLKLAQALLAEHPKLDRILPSMLKVAALGTVADVVDLGTLENRAIVALGLEGLMQPPHAPGLAALLTAAGLDGGPIQASDLGYKIGPRINAAGRLARATAVIELFDSPDAATARTRAAALEALNQERRRIQDRMVRAALEQVPQPVPAFVVVACEEGEDWHRGLTGVVAGKVRDHVHRPVAVIAIHGDTGRGSVRSLPSVHAVRALDAAVHLLRRHGGHPAAAGFDVPPDKIAALTEVLCAHVEAHANTLDLTPTLELDGCCPLSEVTFELARALERIGPYGKGNPEPIFLMEGVRLDKFGAMGDRHLRARAEGIDTVWWGGLAHRDALSGPVDLAAKIQINRWRGRANLRLTIEDVRPSGG